MGKDDLVTLIGDVLIGGMYVKLVQDGVPLDEAHVLDVEVHYDDALNHVDRHGWYCFAETHKGPYGTSIDVKRKRLTLTPEEVKEVTRHYDNLMAHTLRGFAVPKYATREQIDGALELFPND